jgi:NAD(P)-dependent dehydrogenase (short-subunit alcohol dehydrogenase family)
MVQWNQGCSLLCVEIARTGVRPEQHPIQFDMPAICEHRAVRTMGPTELTLTNAYSSSHKFLGKENTPENRAYFVSLIPLARLTDVTDIANGCCFLASDEANYITGTELIIDGGRSA